jgi:hypothetical protein
MVAPQAAAVGTLALATTAVGMAGAPAPTIQPLFTPGAAGPLSYPCFRQPELSALMGGTHLIAWTEAYPVATPGPNGSCAPALRGQGDVGSRGGSGDVCDLVYRRSDTRGRTYAQQPLLAFSDLREAAVCTQLGPAAAAGGQPQPRHRFNRLVQHCIRHEHGPPLPLCPRSCGVAARHCAVPLDKSRCYLVLRRATRAAGRQQRLLAGHPVSSGL